MVKWESTTTTGNPTDWKQAKRPNVEEQGNLRLQNNHEQGRLWIELYGSFHKLSIWFVIRFVSVDHQEERQIQNYLVYL